MSTASPARALLAEHLKCASTAISNATDPEYAGDHREAMMSGFYNSQCAVLLDALIKADPARADEVAVELNGYGEDGGALAEWVGECLADLVNENLTLSGGAA